MVTTLLRIHRQNASELPCGTRVVFLSQAESEEQAARFATKALATPWHRSSRRVSSRDSDAQSRKWGDRLIAFSLMRLHSPKKPIAGTAEERRAAEAAPLEGFEAASDGLAIYAMRFRC